MTSPTDFCPKCWKRPCECADLTPVESPDAKRKSGQHRMGLVVCPSCNGVNPACNVCEGIGVVAVDRAIAWTTERGE